MSRMSGWRQYYPDASSQFMWNEVHSAIKAEYKQKFENSLIQKEQKQALRLQKYLQEIKYYINHKAVDGSKKNFLQQAELQIFIKILKTVRTNDGKSLESMFMTKDILQKGETSTNNFQQDIQDILKAILKVYQPQQKNYKNFEAYLPIDLGQKISIPPSFYYDFGKLSEETLKNIALHFSKKTKQAINKIKTQSGLLSSVQVKVDVSGNTYITETVIDGQTPLGDNFSDFARLMLNGTFSLKNYTNRQVVLKPVTDLRVLIELLPSLIPNPMARKGAISSFILALSHRLSGPVNTYPSTTNRSQVYQTLGELSYIHRLTGRGQSYIGIVDTEGYEMNTLEYQLSQGAKYLIYNVPISDQIYVTSTRFILKKYLDAHVDSKKNFTITKTFIKTAGKRKK